MCKEVKTYIGHMASPLTIPFLDVSQDSNHSIWQRLALQGSSLQLHSDPWNPSITSVRVGISMGHNNHHFWLAFFVEEPRTLARYQTDGNPVYRDSCVEFFFTSGGPEYFNFEFNALGACLCERGTGRRGRTSLGKIFSASIIRKPSLEETLITPMPQKSWALGTSLPLSKLLGRSLGGLSLRGNFYKCGDDLPQPHYLCWNPVLTESPDFHRPEFFSEIRFADGPAD